MNYLSLALASTVMATAPALAQDAAGNPAPTSPAAAGAPTTPSAAQSVTVGAAVSDPSGGAVGTIESVNGPNATVSTGTAKASLPLTSFAKGEKGVVIGMTKADLEAAVAKASAPADITVGKAVVGPTGASVGTVDAVSGDLVTIAMPSGKVQLPKSGFAAGQGGALMIGMTPEQLQAAAKAASGGATPKR